jgi:predicted metalloprotease with PDZ domain
MDQMAGSLRLSVGSVYRPTLGVAIKEGQRAGSVRVIRVHDQMPAVGRLEVDDEIIGVDGRLLDLEDPVADLRRRVAQRGGPDHMSVRVRRRDRLLDVTVPLPRPRPEAAPAPPPADPIKAIEQFQSAARLLNSASYIVYRSPVNQFHARVSLQLAPAKEANTTTAGGPSDQARR